MFYLSLVVTARKRDGTIRTFHERYPLDKNFVDTGILGDISKIVSELEKRLNDRINYTVLSVSHSVFEVS